MSEHYECGVRAEMGAMPVVLLPTKRPTYWITDPDGLDVSPAVFEAALVNAYESWSRHIDVRWSRAASLREATHRIDVARLGGRVLADQMLPFRDAVQLRMRVNSLVDWSRPSSFTLQGVLAHEIGHFLGFGHQPAGPPNDLMDPVARADVTVPQAWEIQQGIAWYGPAVAAPAPEPVPPGGELQPMYVLTVKRDGGTQDVVGFYPIDQEQEALEAAARFFDQSRGSRRAIVRLELYNPAGGAP